MLPRSAHLPILALIVAVSMLPLASAREIDAGPIHVAIENSPDPDCWVPLDGEACAVAWDENGTATMADDRFGVAQVVKTASVSIDVEGEPYTLNFQAEDFVIEHPANHILNATWVLANDSLPAPVKEYVTLESGAVSPWSEGVMIVRHFPLPAPDLGDNNWLLGPRQTVYSWDCGYYFTSQGNWDDACSYDWVRPIPFGVEYGTSSDRQWDWLAHTFQCDTLTFTGVPNDYCAGTDVVHEHAATAAQAWKDASPNVTLGASVEEVTVEVAPGVSLQARAPSTGPALGPRTGYSALPTQAPASKLSVAPPTSGADPVAAPRALAPVAQKDDRAPLETKGQSLQASPHVLWPPVVVAAAVAVGGLVLLAAFLLYHRATSHATLENQNRLRIYEAIRDEPGIRAGTLKVKLGLGYQTIVWHLKVLEEFHMVEAVGEGQRRFFINGGSFSAQEKQAIMAASTPAARAIFELVQEKGETPFAELPAALNISHSTASETVGRLQQAGLVRKRRVNGRLCVAAVVHAGPGKPAVW